MTARQTVLARAGWRCERCLALPIDHVHHRRPKGMGGSDLEWVDRPANLVALCRACHEWVHAHPAEARHSGWLISKWGAMADAVSVVDLQGRRWSLTDDGAKWDAVDALGGSPDLPWP